MFSCYLDNIISIHALLAESDERAENHANTQQEFLSTLSLRRATLGQFRRVLLVGYFYPRSPCGERLLHCTTYLNCSRFLSTLSLRRATLNQIQPRGFHYHFYPRSPCGERLRQVDRVGKTRRISIHALLAESDEHAYQLVLWVLRFLSTLSLRRATRAF